MAVQGTVLLLLNAVVVLQSIRLELGLEDEPEPDEKCVEFVRHLLGTMTYRQSLSPIMDDTYRLRVQDSNQYLADDLGLVDANPGEWIVEQVPQARFDNSMPKYTIQNKETKTFLKRGLTVDSNGFLSAESLGEVYLGTSSPDDVSSYWQMDSAAEGVWIRSPTNGQGGETTDPVEAWVLESQSRSKRKYDIDRQWDVTSKLPVFPGMSFMRWGEFCRISECGSEKYYKTERERQRSWGKLDMDERTVVSENLVPGGICAMDVELLKDMVNNPRVVKELHSASKSACPTCSDHDFAMSLSKAVQAECFDSCESHVDTLLKDLPCEKHEMISANWTSIFEQAVVNEQCGLLPPDTLEELAEYRMTRKCNIWHPPSLLWVMNDRGEEMTAPQHAVCKVPGFLKSFTRSSDDILQKGSCPEGTVCDCPKTWLTEQLSLDDRRDRKHSFCFVTPGSAIPPVVFKYMKDKVATKFLVKILVAVATDGASLGLHTPLKIVNSIFASHTWRGERAWGTYGKFEKRFHKDLCGKHVACWAVPPEKKKTDEGSRCRVSQEAQAGGSPVWFLPPPLMMVQKTRFKCILAPCTEEDAGSQKVGFGGEDGENIYNCQPLIWEDMDEPQKSKLTEVLRQTGVHKEYSW